MREFLNAAARQGGLKIAPHLPGEAVNSVHIGNRTFSCNGQVEMTLHLD